jgi:hypothetical protein
MFNWVNDPIYDKTKETPFDPNEAIKTIEELKEKL